ncbi:hypothetical protein [Sulfurovum sp.]|uniref:hypothetical protein n=1 Tax=Sulfurovum sp. TaxID=1969726 RepID=UPI0035691D13
MADKNCEELAKMVEENDKIKFLNEVIHNKELECELTKLREQLEEQKNTTKKWPKIVCAITWIIIGISILLYIYNMYVNNQRMSSQINELTTKQVQHTKDCNYTTP